MKKLKGFTLVELLVVIAVIGILSAVVVLNTNSAKTKAREANMKTSLNSVQNLATMCTDEKDSVPTLKLASADTLTQMAATDPVCSGSSTIADKYPTPETGYVYGVTSGSTMVAGGLPVWVVGAYKTSATAANVLMSCNSSKCVASQL